MPDIDELCYVAKFGLFSLFGTQVGQPFSIQISILEESHASCTREMMELCLEEPEWEAPVRTYRAEEDLESSPSPADLGLH